MIFCFAFAAIAPKIMRKDRAVRDYEGLDEAKMLFGEVTAHLNASVALERFIDSGGFLGIARTQEDN